MAEMGYEARMGENLESNSYVSHKLVGKSGCLPFPGCSSHLEPVVLKKLLLLRASYLELVISITQIFELSSDVSV